MRVFTKEEIISELRQICESGWIESSKRLTNHGAVGNLLEDLMGIPENNLPIANASEWELKTRKLRSKALVTLCHLEPSPRVLTLVPRLLLPNYGWKHKSAGIKYPETELSFRQTISTLVHSNRGFKVILDRQENKIIISFDVTKVSSHHNSWLKDVEERTGLGELSTQPYWGVNDIMPKIHSKLANMFFVEADTKIAGGKYYAYYRKALMLRNFSYEKFIDAIESGLIYVDFDARTGHNHGTKFRCPPALLPGLYEEATLLFEAQIV